MESARELLLDTGLDLIGKIGLRKWSMRAVEDAAQVPHGTARHHFGNQRDFISAIVQHLVAKDMPRDTETPTEQVQRWIGEEANYTRARYELLIASFHDDQLATELIEARESLIATLAARGFDAEQARMCALTLDGIILDTVLRRESEPSVPPQSVIDLYTK